MFSPFPGVKRLTLLSPLAMLLLAICCCPSPASSSVSVEIDVASFVYAVVDGDTFDAFPVGRVRLADVNTPERGEPGYNEAKGFLNELVYNRWVYLDVDHVQVRDRYNRLICVAYVRYNSTHLLNVNFNLVVNGLAEVRDYPNEFNPDSWSLFVYYPTDVLPGTYEALLQAYLQLRGEHDHLLEELSHLRGEYERLLSEHEVLKMGYEELKGEHERLLREYEALKSDYEKLELKCRDLELECNRLTSDLNASRSILLPSMVTVAVCTAVFLRLISRWRGR